MILIEAGPRASPSLSREPVRRPPVRALMRLGVEVRTRRAGHRRRRRSRDRGRGADPERTVVCGQPASPLRPRRNGWRPPRTIGGASSSNPTSPCPVQPEIFVVGDTAAMKDPKGGPVPGVAPAAKQAGAHAAATIKARLLKNAAPGPFRYRHAGNLATIGRRAAVIDFGWLKLRGMPAWWLWGAAPHLFSDRISQSADGNAGLALVLSHLQTRQRASSPAPVPRIEPMSPPRAHRRAGSDALGERPEGVATDRKGLHHAIAESVDRECGACSACSSHDLVHYRTILENVVRCPRPPDCGQRRIVGISRKTHHAPEPGARPPCRSGHRCSRRLCGRRNSRGCQCGAWRWSPPPARGRGSRARARSRSRRSSHTRDSASARHRMRGPRLSRHPAPRWQRRAPSRSQGEALGSRAAPAAPRFRAHRRTASIMATGA